MVYAKTITLDKKSIEVWENLPFWSHSPIVRMMLKRVYDMSPEEVRKYLSSELTGDMVELVIKCLGEYKTKLVPT